MVIFIIICVVAFLFVVLLVNYPKIKNAIKNRPPKIKVEKQKKDPDKTAKKENLSYDEKVFKEKIDTIKVDNLDRDKLEEKPFVNISEEELKELENKTQKGTGRKYKQPEKKEENKPVYPDYYYDDDDYEEDDFDDLHDMYDTNEASEVAEEIKNLSPELKAILISNVLKKKDDI